MTDLESLSDIVNNDVLVCNYQIQTKYALNNFFSAWTLITVSWDFYIASNFIYEPCNGSIDYCIFVYYYFLTLILHRSYSLKTSITSIV